MDPEVELVLVMTVSVLRLTDWSDALSFTDWSEELKRKADVTMVTG